MKKISIITAIASVMFFITGCGESSNWYPIEGGYINLKQAHRITTEIKLANHFRRTITENNINEIKKIFKEKLGKNEKSDWFSYEAFIDIDGFKITLAKGSGEITLENFEDMLDSCLDAVEDLEDRL